MADFVSMLVDMGFNKERAEIALEKTGNRGVEPAMEWLFSNPEPEPETSSKSATDGEQHNKESENPPSTEENSKEGESSKSSEASAAAPKSYKCDDCGKLFSNMELVEFHAAKSNHSNFSESTEEKKPLTAEEKEEQQKKLMEVIKQKRAEREAKEKQDAIESEKRRMATGKELGEAKRRMQEQQMKELAEQRRREKIEDKLAKQKVLQQIEADKAARKARQEAEMNKSDSSQCVPPTTSSSNANTSASVVVAEKKEYSQTKLQIRLPNGKSMVQTFGVAEPLQAVRLWIELNRNDGMEGPFKLMRSHPKKVFEGDEYEMPLQILDLVPSAVLMVTKS